MDITEKFFNTALSYVVAHEAAYAARDAGQDADHLDAAADELHDKFIEVGRQFIRERIGAAGLVEAVLSSVLEARK